MHLNCVPFCSKKILTLASCLGIAKDPVSTGFVDTTDTLIFQITDSPFHVTLEIPVNNWWLDARHRSYINVIFSTFVFEYSSIRLPEDFQFVGRTKRNLRQRSRDEFQNCPRPSAEDQIAHGQLFYSDHSQLGPHIPWCLLPFTPTLMQSGQTNSTAAELPRWSLEQGTLQFRSQNKHPRTQTSSDKQSAISCQWTGWDKLWISFRTLIYTRPNSQQRWRTNTVRRCVIMPLTRFTDLVYHASWSSCAEMYLPMLQWTWAGCRAYGAR